MYVKVPVISMDVTLLQTSTSSSGSSSVAFAHILWVFHVWSQWACRYPENFKLAPVATTGAVCTDPWQPETSWRHSLSASRSVPELSATLVWKWIEASHFSQQPATNLRMLLERNTRWGTAKANTPAIQHWWGGFSSLLCRRARTRWHWKQVHKMVARLAMATWLGQQGPSVLLGCRMGWGRKVRGKRGCSSRGTGVGMGRRSHGKSPNTMENEEGEGRWSKEGDEGHGVTADRHKVGRKFKAERVREGCCRSRGGEGGWGWQGQVAKGSYTERWVCPVKVTIAKMKCGRGVQCRPAGTAGFQRLLEKKKPSRSSKKCVLITPEKRDPGFPSLSSQLAAQCILEEQNSGNKCRWRSIRRCNEIWGGIAEVLGNPE